MTDRCRLSFIVYVLLLCVSCQGDRLRVEKVVEPEYPVAARVQNIQGTVQVTLCFGVDGKVGSATGAGAHPLLARAAEDNAREWVFGPLPPVGEYPKCHNVEYVYKLEGTPLPFVLRSGTVKVDLPDRVEIIARPFKSDYPPVEKAPLKPAGRAETP